MKSLQNNYIAYLSCDTDSYTAGNLDVTGVLGIATVSRPLAIILYSRNSSRCAVNKNGVYNPLYTMLDAHSATMVEGQLMKEPGGVPADGVIKTTNNSTGGGGGGGNSQGTTGRSPTTAVAMIILYSITGIITAMFLLIIIVGAIRAHRHPERYGPRNTIGITRQSRAKGIARAMLETLPIVKFGDHEEVKPGQPAGSLDASQNRDIELGTTNTEPDHAQPPSQHPRTSTDEAPPQTHSSGPISDSTQPELVTTESANASPSTSDAIGSSPETNAENGLACSVCTDEFVKGQDVRVLPCNHKFHPECIDPWLLNVSGTCPLCRVDLRPTTSHGENGEGEAGEAHENDSNTGHEEPQASAGTTETSARLGPPSLPVMGEERRGSRQRFSAFVPHVLNRHRMRDATPEERIAALRRYRTARAEQRTGGEPTASEPSHQRNSRWTRVFGNDTSRRGSYAG